MAAAMMGCVVSDSHKRHPCRSASYRTPLWVDVDPSSYCKAAPSCPPSLSRVLRQLRCQSPDKGTAQKLDHGQCLYTTKKWTLHSRGVPRHYACLECLEARRKPRRATAGGLQWLSVRRT